MTEESSTEPTEDESTGWDPKTILMLHPRGCPAEGCPAECDSRLLPGD